VNQLPGFCPLAGAYPWSSLLMKRIRRTLLASIASIGMIASIALAGPGPGGYSDGDPYEPHIIKPTGHGKGGAVNTAGSSVSGTSRAAVSPSSENEWKVLRIYLILQRAFLL
jgi:hypothetical protein